MCDVTSCVAVLQRGFDAQWLSDTFSKAIFLGNGLVAIVSGEASAPVLQCYSATVQQGYRPRLLDPQWMTIQRYQEFPSKHSLAE